MGTVGFRPYDPLPFYFYYFSEKGEIKMRKRSFASLNTLVPFNVPFIIYKCQRFV